MAESIVRVAAAHADGRRIARVEVKVGRLRQVVPRTLAFGFELAARGTAADGAELAIEHVPATAACRACGVETELVELPFVCRRCGGTDLEIEGGQELHVEAIELEEDACTGRA